MTGLMELAQATVRPVDALGCPAARAHRGALPAGA